MKTNKYKKAFDTFEDMLFPIHFYPTKDYWKNIDTVEEACDKAAKYDEKETAKEPTIDSGVTYCPRCHWIVNLTFTYNNDLGLVVHPDKYCHNCGQRLREE